MKLVELCSQFEIIKCWRYLCEISYKQQYSKNYQRNHHIKHIETPQGAMVNRLRIIGLEYASSPFLPMKMYVWTCQELLDDCCLYLSCSFHSLFVNDNTLLFYVSVVFLSFLSKYDLLMCCKEIQWHSEWCVVRRSSDTEDGVLKGTIVT